MIKIKSSNTMAVRWAFDVASWKPTESQWLLASSCIQSEEKERISRFVFKKDSKSSLIGRLMMRKYVAENSNIPYSQIRFDRDERGKPFLLNENVILKFNVSHQGSYAVLAGENNNISLGIDVMKLEYSGGKSISEFFRLMTRHFSSKEWDSINGNYGTPDNVKLAAFCRHWSLKESYVKATGTGITVNLQQLSFQSNSKLLEPNKIIHDTSLFLHNDLLKDWTFEETLLDDKHCVSVALNKSHSNVTEHPKFLFLSFDDLMKDCEPLLPRDEISCANFFNKHE